MLALQLLLAALAAPLFVLASPAFELEIRATHAAIPAAPVTQCTPSGPTTYNYVGCYVDVSTTRPLAVDAGLPQSNLTIEECTTACNSQGYRYAGLEYSFQCFCDASVGGPGLAANQSDCSYACSGDSTQICGGPDRMSIYENPNYATVDGTTISDYIYQGCYTDTSSLRALPVRLASNSNTSSATIESCLSACKQGGYPHAGLEYYGECYCGAVLANSSMPADPGDCNTPCNGNSSEICGGPNRISYYVASDLEEAPPCPTTIPVTSAPITTTSTTSATSTFTTTSATSTKTTTSSKTTPTASTASKTTTSCTTTSKTTTTCTTTSKPTVVPTAPTTTSITSTSTCTAYVPKPTCEYGCGKWCSTPLPSWSGFQYNDSFLQCTVQLANCFAEAGFPANLECWAFSSWCRQIPGYKSKDLFLSACPAKNGPTPPKAGTCYK